MSPDANASLNHEDTTGAPWRGAAALKVFPLSRSVWSLAAIADGLANSHGRKPVFAVPDYFCNISLWPLRQNRAELVFYPIEPDGLQPDWRACDRLPAIDAFVLVHYFGKAADAARAHCFAQSRGAILIEDAAHVLRPINGIGEQGDFVIYSPHKLLPVPDGAFLVVRQPAVALLPSILAALENLGKKPASTLVWRMQRSRLRSLFPHRSTEASSFNADEELAPPAQTPIMSKLAATLIAKADLDTIAERRQRNARVVLAAVAHLPGLAPVFSLAGDWVPHHLPMRCASQDLARRYFDRLRRDGLAAETWPVLPPEVSVCSAARRLRETVFLLPSHQFLDIAHLMVP